MPALVEIERKIKCSGFAPVEGELFPALGRGADGFLRAAFEFPMRPKDDPGTTFWTGHARTRNAIRHARIIWRSFAAPGTSISPPIAL